VFKRIDGEHSVQKDLSDTNPNFETGLEGYTLNCANCTAAYEMRRRGFDVEALPRMLTPIEEWANLFEGFRQQTPTSVTKVAVAEELEQKILQWGEGARGTIYGEVVKKNVGHFFSAEVSGGKVMFVDGQINSDDVKWYFNALKPSSIRYGRLDNLKASDAIRNAIRNKGG